MLMGLDPLYWVIMIPCFLFALWAQNSVKSAFNKYTKFGLRSGISGGEAARLILQQNGLNTVSVEAGRGFLTDHYDPIQKKVRLSPQVYNGRSIAAVGIAAHETGHALQHKQNYAPLALRSMLAPTASIGSNFAFIIIFFGFIINLTGLVKIGIVLFAAVVVFQLITLPVEFDASARAKKLLASYGIATSEEIRGVNSVLNAAAMTYVAAAASAIAQLLYLLLRTGFLGGDD
jgi:Zn-dependent membrane protease YugP